VRPTVDEMQSLRSFFLLIVKQLVIGVGQFVCWALTDLK
jgi:hypothetical protein